MKQGNQFYLEFEIVDNENNKLDIKAVLKVQFNIGNLTKIYDGIGEEATYQHGVLQVYLTEEETFNFDGRIKMDARILFKGDTKTIGGTYIIDEYWYDSLKEEILDV